MEFVVQDPAKLDQFVAVLKTLKPSYSILNVMCTAEQGMLIQNLDRSHVCLCHLQLQPAWFDRFVITAPDNNACNFSVDTGMWLTILQHKVDGHAMRVVIEEDNMAIEFGAPDVPPQTEPTAPPKKRSKKAVANEESATPAPPPLPAKGKKMTKKTFKLALINFEYEQLGIPEMDNDVECTLASKDFAQVMQEMADFGDNVTIVCTETSVEFSGKDESKEARVELSVEDMVSYGIVEDATIQSSFKTAYMNSMVTAKISEHIEFGFSADRPIQLTYSLLADSSLSFFVAPFCNV